MKSFKEEFESIKAERKDCKATKVFDEIKQTASGRPLVLYGAANVGKSVIGICRELGMAVACVCDRSATGLLSGVQIITPEELKTGNPNALVIVCSKAYNDEINAELGHMGFSSGQVIAFPFEYPFFSSLSDFEPHIPGFEWAYDFFADELSKQLVLDRIRLILCDRGIAPNTESGLYFEDGLITLGNNEVFVDGGAFDGDTAMDFQSRCSGPARQSERKSASQLERQRKSQPIIYSFEPDEENYGKASAALAGLEGVTLINKGLWSSETELLFIAGLKGRSSVAREDGKADCSVPVVSLDGFFADKPKEKWPTFIKLDIEGAENEALLGAAAIIKARKPKLAICAYHLTQDIYKLPRTISSIRDDYRFALRQHSYGCEDTVLYAV